MASGDRHATTLSVNAHGFGTVKTAAVTALAEIASGSKTAAGPPESEGAATEDAAISA